MDSLFCFENSILDQRRPQAFVFTACRRFCKEHVYVIPINYLLTAVRRWSATVKDRLLLPPNVLTQNYFSTYSLTTERGMRPGRRVVMPAPRHATSRWSGVQVHSPEHSAVSARANANAHSRERTVQPYIALPASLKQKKVDVTKERMKINFVSGFRYVFNTSPKEARSFLSGNGTNWLM